LSIRRWLSEWLAPRYRVARRTLALWRMIPYRELWQRETARDCLICQRHPRIFFPYGVNPRPNALCPFCGSLERHRLVYLFMREQTNLFAPPRKRMLHVAPEPCFAGVFSKQPAIEYVTADLRPGAMVRGDLTALGFANAAFDVIYCSHVLEHIPDDGAAMRELFRVLRPEGWAILQAPINARVTREDPPPAAVAEGGQIFGAPGHVRIYGEDYYARLRQAGFVVQRCAPVAQWNPARLKQFGLTFTEPVNYCSKPA
jgi:SAM-dependent methyltransferase